MTIGSFASLLGVPLETEPYAGIDDWWARHRAAPGTDPFTRAAGGGFRADRLGYAFASGYVEALRALAGGDVTTPRSLAVTEHGAPTPRSIATMLQDGVLTGEKSFATLGSIAEEFLVACRRGVHPDGKPDIAVVRLPRGRAGLRVEPGPQTSFTPEVPHARLVLADVAVQPDEVLPGDGYSDHLKRFRTIEDIHVHGATLAYLLRCARAFDWPVADALVAQLDALAMLAAADPLAPETHLALGDVLDVSRSLLERVDTEGMWERGDAQTQQRWARDRDLLKVAGAVRAARLERARRSAPSGAGVRDLGGGQR